MTRARTPAGTAQARTELSIGTACRRTGPPVTAQPNMSRRSPTARWSEVRCSVRPLCGGSAPASVRYSAEMTTPPMWSYGKFVLGCGMFGGMGGSPELVGRGWTSPRRSRLWTSGWSGHHVVRHCGELCRRCERDHDRPLAGRARLGGHRPSSSRYQVAPPGVDGPGGRFDTSFLEEKFSGSLRRLGVETVEFLLTHAPDDGTPIEETLEGSRRYALVAAAVTWARATLVRASSRPPSKRLNGSAPAATKSCRTATACSGPETTEPYGRCAPSAIWRSRRSRPWPAVHSPGSTNATSSHPRLQDGAATRWGR